MRRMTRKPPPSPHDKAPKGHCRMCGEQILRRDGSLLPNKTRRWCDAHQLEARIMQHVVFARAAVFLRDRGICKDCGEDCTSYIGYDLAGFRYKIQINRERALDWCYSLLWKKGKDGKRRLRPQNPRAPQSAGRIDLGQWEADHQFPLWLVDRDKPDAWKYWSLDNLVTRCPSCHQEKTNTEAGRRAWTKRMNGETKKKRKGPKIQQRANPWPPKGSRKLGGKRA